MTTTRKKPALPGPQPKLFSEATSTQSMHYLMLADHELELLTYRGPVDMRIPEQVLTAIAEIWPDEMADQLDNTRAVNAKKKFLPQDDGMYYLVILDTDAGERLPMLLADGEVVARVDMLAAKAGKAKALRTLPRYGQLPRV